MYKKSYLHHTPGCQKAAWGILFIASVYIFLSGCATQRQSYYNTLNNLMAEEQYPQADKKVQESYSKVYKEKDLLLYYFDRGLMLHQAGEWEQSNEMFAKADQLAQTYFTKSISTQALTLMISDNMNPYYGEDFERAMIHVFSSLNYLYLDQPDEALVEARRVDFFLRTLQSDYGYKSYYKEDAFIRYLMGMIYESQGEINDAFISYRKALDTYQSTKDAYGVRVPQNLVMSTLQTAHYMGFDEEFEQIAGRYPQIKKNFIPLDNTGEIVLLHYNGLIPHKIDNILHIAFDDAWPYVAMIQVDGEAEENVNNAYTVLETIGSDEQVVIAFPTYTATPYDIMLSRVVIDDTEYETELVQDIGQIAVRSLSDKKERIFARTVARAAVKYALSHAAGKKIEEKTDNELAEWILKKTVKAAAALTEKADKRSWRTLPDQIRMSRIRLPEGKYSIIIKFIDRKGYVVEERSMENIQVFRKKKKFLYIRSAQ